MWIDVKQVEYVLFISEIKRFCFLFYLFVFRIGNINLHSRKITLFKMLAPLWDELEERQRRKFLKELLEKRETVLQRKRRKEKGRFREGGHQRMQVEEERVTGKQRHTKKDSEDGEEVGEKRSWRWGRALRLGLSWVLGLTASRRSMSIAALNSPLRAGKRAFLLYFQPSKYFQKVVKTLLISESILVSEGFFLI